MATLIQTVRESFRHDFGSTMFLIISGLVALVFIGYLAIDLIKGIASNPHRKKKHQAHPPPSRPE